MKQKCLRCIAQLSLVELSWVDESRSPIHLEGPSVFLRACVLGQLQHSHLQRPLFPIKFSQDLQFDRIFTNCHDPTLLSEVLRGEHVKIELIQVRPDYQGGKILARYDAPAHKFLFPGPSESTGDSEELRKIQLTKSRKYLHPPVLTFHTSTSLLETTVNSPIETIFCTESSLTSPSSSKSSVASSTPSSNMVLEGAGLSLSQLQHPPASHMTGRTAVSSSSKPGSVVPPSTAMESPQSRIHALLSSYTQPAEQPQAPEDHKQSKKHYRVKFKPPVPVFSQSRSKSGYDPLSLTGVPATARSDRLATTMPVQSAAHSWTKHVANTKRQSSHNHKSSSLPSSPILARSGDHSHRNQEQGRGLSHMCSRVGADGGRGRGHASGPTRGRSLTSEQAKPRRRCCDPQHRPVTVPNHVPLYKLPGFREQSGSSLLGARRPVPDLKPPFVVRQVDPNMISKREFQDDFPPVAEKYASNRSAKKKHSSKLHGSKSPAPSDLVPLSPLSSHSDGGGESKLWEWTTPPLKCYDSSTVDSTSSSSIAIGTKGNMDALPLAKSSSSCEYRVGLSSSSGEEWLPPDPREVGTPLTELYKQYLDGSPRTKSKAAQAPPTPKVHVTTPCKLSSDDLEESSGGLPRTSKDSVRHVCHCCQYCGKEFKSAEEEGDRECRGACGPANPAMQLGKEDLIRKYHPGNMREEVGSPSKRIQERLKKVLKECCQCRKLSADCLGEDSVSEDIERVRASLSAQRNETMNKSARLLPDQSVTVKVGPQDYWSQRMSEFTGKTHRVLFDENLEKIYHKLYMNATEMP